MVVPHQEEHVEMASRKGIPGDFTANEDAPEVPVEEMVQKTDRICSSCNRRICNRLPKGEVLGICYISVSMGSIINANVFLSTGLMYLARIDAGCTNPGPCESRVHGMLPSSLLTNMAVMGGLIIAVTLPIIGSLVDYTPYRRQVGAFSAALLVTLNAVQIALSLSTWFAMAIVQLVATFMLFVQRVVTQAYIPDLSDDVDKQNQYNATFVSVEFASMVLCMIVVMALSLIVGADDILMARIGQAVVVVVCSLAQGFAWLRLMKNRPAMDTIPEGSSLLSAGFRKVYHTTKEVCAKYRALMWFFVSAMFTGAGQAGFASTATTVAIVILGMNSTLVGAMALTIFIFGIPGGALSHWITKRFDPLRSLMGSILLLIITTEIAAAVLRSPDQKLISFIFAVLWGLGMGWSMSAERTCFAMIIPSGAPAELYGTWYFYSAVLSWAPPLVFSSINEAGVSMQWGLASIGFFFVGALVFLFPIGGFERAVDQVMKRDDNSSVEEGRRRSSVALLPPPLLTQ